MTLRSALVVGGGTMGLATAWVLARRGVAVTVLERFDHAHDLGSHGGYTRIIRQAYHEGEHYVPLVQRADRLWVELGQRRGRALLERTGLLELGPTSDAAFAQSIAACERYGVARDLYDAPAAMARWPFVVPRDWIACFSPSGGYLRVHACLDALRDEAVAAGAVIRHRVVVREVDGDTGTVVLDDGERVTADVVVVAAGAWLPQVLPGFLPGRLRPLRRVVTWWTPDASHVARLASLPVWATFDPGGFFYGFPHGDEGVTGLKVALHLADGTGEPAIDPDTVDRQVHERDLQGVRAFIAERFPIATGPIAAHRVCLYTATPTWDFVIDRVPDAPRVVVAGGFSGHGFKFAPAVGEVVADLCADPDAAAPSSFCAARHLG